MKDVRVFLFVVALVLVFSVGVFATVDGGSYTFQTDYSPGENIKGLLNLTLEDEDYNIFLTSSEGDSISLKNFFEANEDKSNFSFECSPGDCSSNYELSSGSNSKTFPLDVATDEYFGFVIYGENVDIGSINFTLSSDFEREEARPLEASFFEDVDWRYETFSDEEYSGRRHGCYDFNNPVYSDSLIGRIFYCEQIYVHETNSLFVGADVDAGDTADLQMRVCSDGGCSTGDECEFDPAVEEGCYVTMESGTFPTANYSICVGSVDGNPTDYRIFTDSTGESCGYFDNGFGNVENSEKDYAIFASMAKYESASALGDLDLDFEALRDVANDIIYSRYGRDCTEGCVLPIRVSGVPQNLVVSDVKIGYSSSDNFIETKVYSLDAVSAKVDFDGVVDLSLTGFNITSSGEYSLFLDGELIVKKNVRKLPAPVVNSVSPLNPPANVPVTFYVGVTNAGNSSLTYNWNFGDGTKATTTTSNVSHTYPEISVYVMTVEVLNEDSLGSSRSFTVTSQNPKFAIESTLKQKRIEFEEFVKTIRRDFTWYSEVLENTIDVQGFYDELDALDALEVNACGDGQDNDNDCLVLAERLYAFEIPVELLKSIESGFSFFTEIEDIDPEVIVNFAGGISGNDLEGYDDAILRWQGQNIESDITSNLFSVGLWNGGVQGVFRTYDLSVNSFYEGASYLVINKPFGEIFFKEDAISMEAKKQGDTTIIVLDALEQEKSFEFYVKDSDEVSFFVAPKLSEIVVDAQIDDSCNYNNVCEEGEDYNTCRADCKPVKLAGFYIFLSILFGLVLYSVLQLWYKVHYENYLFGGDRNGLFNLLNFVTNARSRGVSESEIRKGLGKQGWSLERINYILKKSKGQRTGMFEIIPFEKVFSYFRNRRAMKKVALEGKQQSGGKVNKSPYRTKLK